MLFAKLFMGLFISTHIPPAGNHWAFHPFSPLLYTEEFIALGLCRPISMAHLTAAAAAGIPTLSNWTHTCQVLPAKCSLFTLHGLAPSQSAAISFQEPKLATWHTCVDHWVFQHHRQNRQIFISHENHTKILGYRKKLSLCNRGPLRGFMGKMELTLDWAEYCNYVPQVLVLMVPKISLTVCGQLNKGWRRDSAGSRVRSDPTQEPLIFAIPSYLLGGLFCKKWGS